MRRYIKEIVKEVVEEIVEEKIQQQLYDILDQIQKSEAKLSIICDPSHFLGRITSMIKEGLIQGLKEVNKKN